MPEDRESRTPSVEKIRAAREHEREHEQAVELVRTVIAASHKHLRRTILVALVLGAIVQALIASVVRERAPSSAVASVTSSAALWSGSLADRRAQESFALRYQSADEVVGQITSHAQTRKAIFHVIEYVRGVDHDAQALADEAGHGRRVVWDASRLAWVEVR